MAKPAFLQSAFVGKLGGVVGANWRGIHYYRTDGEVHQPNTPAQLQHKKEFKQLITVANALHKIWFPYVFTPQSGKTLSNQFMTLNKGYYKSHNDEDLFLLPSNYVRNIGGVLSAIRRGTYATAELSNFENDTTGPFVRAIFGYYFPDDFQIYFSYTETAPTTATFNFPEDMTGHKFFIFAQWINENTTTQLVRGRTQLWSDYK